MPFNFLELVFTHCRADEVGWMQLCYTVNLKLPYIFWVSMVQVIWKENENAISQLLDEIKLTQWFIISQISMNTKLIQSVKKYNS